MIKNYLKVVLRNIVKNRVVSFINISGLAIGISCCLLIFLFVKDELSYDRFNKNAANTFKLSMQEVSKQGAMQREWALVSPGYGELLKSNFPAIKKIARIYPWSQPFLTYGEKRILNEDFAFAEQDILNILTFDFVKGNPTVALTGPGKVVITEPEAKKLFGDEDPIGKIIKFKEDASTDMFTVTGVIRALPENSHIHFSCLASFDTWKNIAKGDAYTQLTGNYNYLTYVLLNDPAQAGTLQAQINSFIANNIKGDERQSVYQVNLLPLLDIHLKSGSSPSIIKTGDLKNVYIFSFVGVLLILIACINYANISTACGLRRAKEIGIRKVAGALRSHVIFQFLLESLLLTLISALLSFVIVVFTFPYFNTFTGKSLSLATLYSFDTISVIVLIIIAVTLFSGSYPAFFLSRLLPYKTIQSKFFKNKNAISFSSVLLVMQFFISIGSIICFIVVNRQVNFATQTDLGFARDNVVVVPLQSLDKNKLASFVAQVKENRSVKEITLSSLVPGNNLTDAQETHIFNNASATAQLVKFRLPNVRTDENFFKTYDIKLIAGHNFFKKAENDTAISFIVNLEAVKQIGWKNPYDAIGKKIRYGRYEGFIAGVVNDVYFESFHNKIGPVIYTDQGGKRYASIKINTGNINGYAALIGHLQTKWEQFYPDYPFSYSFMQDRLDVIYQKEIKLKQMITLFSGIVLIVTLMGIFGLASYIVERKSKEIAVRKVLGSSAFDIIVLICRNFSGFIMIAFILAAPVSWYCMHKWLEAFAYRIELKWWFFAAGGLATMSVALATVSFQSAKAALMNPIKSLRSE